MGWHSTDGVARKQTRHVAALDVKTISGATKIRSLVNPHVDLALLGVLLADTCWH
jgi:hypothetical protein